MPCPTLVNETEPFFLDMTINISIAVFKGHGFTASSAGNQMSQWHQQPIPPDSFRGTDLIPVKCQFVLGLAEEHLDCPPFHVLIQNLTGAQGNLRADKSSQGLGGMERILWIADQYHCIIDAVTGEHDSHGLMSIVLFPLEMGLVEIRIFNRVQSP